MSFNVIFPALDCQDPLNIYNRATNEHITLIQSAIRGFLGRELYRKINTHSIGLVEDDLPATDNRAELYNRIHRSRVNDAVKIRILEKIQEVCESSKESRGEHAQYLNTLLHLPFERNTSLLVNCNANQKEFYPLQGPPGVGKIAYARMVATDIETQQNN